MDANMEAWRFPEMGVTPKFTILVGFVPYKLL